MALKSRGEEEPQASFGESSEKFELTQEGVKSKYFGGRPTPKNEVELLAQAVAIMHELQSLVIEAARAQEGSPEWKQSAVKYTDRLKEIVETAPLQVIALLISSGISAMVINNSKEKE